MNKCATNGLNIEGETVYRSQIVKYLGSWLDSELTLKNMCEEEMHKCYAEFAEDKKHPEVPNNRTMYKIGSKPLPISSRLLKFNIIWTTKFYNQGDAEYSELVLGRNKYDSNKEALTRATLAANKIKDKI